MVLLPKHIIKAAFCRNVFTPLTFKFYITLFKENEAHISRLNVVVIFLTNAVFWYTIVGFDNIIMMLCFLICVFNENINVLIVF